MFPGVLLLLLLLCDVLLFGWLVLVQSSLRDCFLVGFLLLLFWFCLCFVCVLLLLFFFQNNPVAAVGWRWGGGVGGRSVGMGSADVRRHDT